MSVRISRERFIGGAAFIAGVVFTRAFDQLVQPLTKPIPESPFSIPEYISRYPVVISRGVNIRDYPQIPTKKHPFPVSRLLGTNTINWSDIELINGVPLEGAQRFVIEHAPLVKGHDTGQVSIEDRWIRLDIKRFDRSLPLPHFISLSGQTAEHVRSLGFYDRGASFSMTRDGKFAVDTGLNSPESFTKEDLGRVIVFKTESYDQIWAKFLSAQLKADTPLLAGQKKYQEVEVIPGGNTFGEKVENKSKNTPAALTDYPTGKAYGFYFKTLGFIPLETRIRDVIMIAEARYGVFFRGNVQGDILDVDGNKIGMDPNQLLVVDGEWLLDPKSRAMTGTT